MPTRWASVRSFQPSGVGASGVSVRRPAATSSHTSCRSRRCTSCGGCAASVDHSRARCCCTRREERGVLAHLQHRAADPVHVAGGGRHVVLPQPRRQVASGREALAATEERRQARGRPRGRLREEGVEVAVDFTGKRQPRPMRHPRPAVGGRVIQRLVVHDREAREMDGVESGKRHQRVVGTRVARQRVHRVEPRPQLRLAAGRDWRDHEEVRLRRHGAGSKVSSPVGS